jgi:hypothetical protein
LLSTNSNRHKCPPGEALEIHLGHLSVCFLSALGYLYLSTTFETGPSVGARFVQFKIRQPANMAYPPPNSEFLPLADFLGMLPPAPPTHGHPAIEYSSTTSYSQSMPLSSHNQPIHISGPAVPAPSTHGHPAIERSSSTAHLHWIQPLDHNQSVYFSDLVVQDYGNTNPSNGSTAGQTLPSLDLDPSHTAAPSQQQPTSHGISNVNMQPMAPPPNPRKRKAPTLRQDGWEPVKARVIELHITKKLPLREVKQAVEAEFAGFAAT